MFDAKGLRRTLLSAAAVAIAVVGIRLFVSGPSESRAPDRAAGPASTKPAEGAGESLSAPAAGRSTKPSSEDGARERLAGKPEAHPRELVAARPATLPAAPPTLPADAAAASLDLSWGAGSLFVASSVDPTLGTKTLYTWMEAPGTRSKPEPLDVPFPEQTDPYVSWDATIVDGASVPDAAVVLGSIDAHIDGVSPLAERYPEVMAAVEAEGAFGVALSESDDSLDTRVRVIGSDGREVLTTTLAELGVDAPALADTRRPVLWRSADGESWSSIDVQESFGDHVLLEAVTERDGLLLAMGTGTYGEPAAWTSSDGERWDPVATAALAPLLEEILPHEGVLAAGEASPPALP